MTQSLPGLMNYIIGLLISYQLFSKVKNNKIYLFYLSWLEEIDDHDHDDHVDEVTTMTLIYFYNLKFRRKN